MQLIRWDRLRVTAAEDRWVWWLVQCPTRLDSIRFVDSSNASDPNEGDRLLCSILQRYDAVGRSSCWLSEGPQGLRGKRKREKNKQTSALCSVACGALQCSALECNRVAADGVKCGGVEQSATRRSLAVRSRAARMGHPTLGRTDSQLTQCARALTTAMPRWLALRCHASGSQTAGG